MAEQPAVIAPADEGEPVDAVRAGLRGQFHHLLDERRRQVVDHVPTEILHHVGDPRAPRARHPCDQHDLRHGAHASRGATAFAGHADRVRASGGAGSSRWSRAIRRDQRPDLRGTGATTVGKRYRAPRTHAPSTRSRPAMTVRVGINGFGRIGRNLFRAAKSLRSRPRLRRRQRPRRPEDDGPPPQVRLGARDRSPTTSRCRRTASASTVTSCGAVGAQPRRSPVGRPRRRRRRRVDRLLHLPRQGGGPPRRRARRSSSSRRRATGADATFVYGVNQKDVRPREPQGRLQRQLHHQLLRAAWSRSSTTRSASSRA